MNPQNPATPPRFSICGNGFKGGVVPGAPADLVGVIVNDIFCKPDPAAVRQLLPARLRPAYDRAEPAFWYDKHDSTRPAYLHLRAQNGRLITTVYAQPIS
jgi:hypothetical protein